jgi:hypothetical protein
LNERVDGIETSELREITWRVEEFSDSLNDSFKLGSILAI